MLAGVATRRHARTCEPVGEQVTGSMVDVEVDDLAPIRAPDRDRAG
jgi:hypothetical protein